MLYTATIRIIQHLLLWMLHLLKITYVPTKHIRHTCFTLNRRKITFFLRSKAYYVNTRIIFIELLRSVYYLYSRTFFTFLITRKHHKHTHIKSNFLISLIFQLVLCGLALWWSHTLLSIGFAVYHTKHIFSVRWI